VTIVQDRQPAGSHAAARKAMIDSQLRPSGVNAAFALQRLASVPREDFVPTSARGVAYMDRAIALGDGRWLAAPLVQGLMLQEAAPTAQDKVLLVDGGSGYLAELLRPLAGTLDVIAPSDALTGSRKKGYSLLVIDGAVEQLPDTLVKRLDEDARVVCGLLDAGVTRLAKGRKVAGEVALMPLAEIGIPVLGEFARPKAWAF
jgi:protein-L-isoaspartate(D-aspartate) O-methyltransferase